MNIKKLFFLSLIIFPLLWGGILVAKGAWTPPAGSPSASNNAPEPINVGDSDQSKGDILSKKGLFRAFGGLDIFNSLYVIGGITNMDGDIILNKPTAASHISNNSFILRSWDAPSSLWEDPSANNFVSFGNCGAVIDTCKLSNNAVDKTAQFSCGASTNAYDGYSCTDYFQTTDGVDTFCKVRSVICRGSGSEFSLKNNVGILQFSSSDNTNPILTLDKSGNLTPKNLCLKNASGIMTCADAWPAGGGGGAYSASSTGGLFLNSSNQFGLKGLSTNNCSNGQYLKWDGSGWVCSSVSGSGGGTDLWSAAGGSSIYYNAGNVGIGTNDPSAALDVKGSIISEGNLIIKSSVGGAGSNGITLGTGNFDNYDVDGTGWQGCSWGNSNGCPSDTTTGGNKDNVFSCPTNNANLNMIDVAKGSPSAPPGSSVEQDTWYKRKVSCYNPDEPAYTIRNDSGFLKFINKDSFSRFSINQSGNVGIGLDPDVSDKLSIGGDLYAYGVSAENFYLGNSATPGHILTAHANGKGTWQAPPSGGGATYWSEVGGSKDIYSGTNRKVGIGLATAPTSTLSVGGNGYEGVGIYSSSTIAIDAEGTNIGVRASGLNYDFYALNPSGKSYFAGNVGIGTEIITSGYKLEVAGNVKANQFSTGDLLFNHNGRVVWRMYEDEKGLYVQSPITGKKYKMMMEEIK